MQNIFPPMVTVKIFANFLKGTEDRHLKRVTAISRQRQKPREYGTMKTKNRAFLGKKAWSTVSVAMVTSHKIRGERAHLV